MVTELLRQLGILVLHSVPTMIIFLILLYAYRYILYRPLMRMLAERRKRTTGAIESAAAAAEAAANRTREYEARLRAARAVIFHQREERIQQWTAQKEAALVEARKAAQQRIAEARAAIEAEAITARGQIESAVGQLAAQALKVVLPTRAGASNSSGAQRLEGVH